MEKDKTKGVSNKNNQRLEDALGIFIQGAGKISSALLGMVNKVGGQIYALLFLNEEPLSLDEISERLGVSKGNVSINIRMLEDFKLVRKIWVKGSRRDYYEAERVYPKKILTDFFDKIQRTMSDALTTIERTKAVTTEAKVGLDGEDKRRANFMLAQLALMGSFYYAAHKYFEDFREGKNIDLKLLRSVLNNPEDINK
jgi:DNA-binding transcriptional regulator GbsR (MarR family)